MKLPAASCALGRWLPAVVWMVLIFAASAQPKLPEVVFLHLEIGGREFGDKLGHFLGYAVLGALVWRALGAGISPWRRALLSASLSTAYGFTDELHQLYVPGRDFDAADIVADALGSGLSGTVLTILKGGVGFGGRTGGKRNLRDKGQAPIQPGRHSEGERGAPGENR